ncbi:MAG: hypothetical protein VX405_12585 [Myxococcota bacterium]|nr:hypothetical protein [Myxococcota bacterium]
MLLSADEASIAMVASRLRRVYVGDTEFREDGLRRVWHRGGAAADIISWVDEGGVIMRQEFTFGGLVVLWTRDQGVTSGLEGSDNAGMPTAKLVDAIDDSDQQLFVISSQILGRIENPDFYLRHLAMRVFERVGKSPEALREHPTGEVTMPHILMERASLNSGRFHQAEEEDDLESGHIGLWIAVAGLAMSLFIGAIWYVASH